jgi:purine-binding chemotaxis protein CheW
VQYLTFSLAAEEYAVEILRVQEIKGFSAITPLPDAPPHIKGVINLRGTVVPIIGLRERFGLPSLPYGRFTLIIVLNVGAKVVGVVVDSVNDVLDLRASDIEPPPDLGARVDTSLVRGLAKTNKRLLTLLEVDRTLDDGGSPRLGASAAAAPAELSA